MSRLLVARTLVEVRFYLAQHPCRCGGMEPPEPSPRGAILWHDGPCPICYRPWAEEFGIPVSAPRFGTTWDTFFGGPEPSSLLDPGEWMMVEEVTAAISNPSPNAGTAELTAYRELITVATAAITETLKFIREPGPRGRLTVEACWTEHGRAKLARRGYRGFTDRGRLEAFRNGLAGSFQRHGGHPVYEGVPITGTL